jgi:manganese-dependent inorganic pyrophosphatase
MFAVVFAYLVAGAVSSGPVSVFGHKKPDTDAITSALVYAWELNSRGIDAKAFRLGDINETAHVLKVAGVEEPPLWDAANANLEVAIVDTNNPDELPDEVGKGKATVHSIVDHHKLAGLTTASPIEIDIRPIVSATSVLYERAKKHGLTPDKTIATLMLAGIMSDSLGFRSPTTTPGDKVNAEELAKIAGVDMHAFADAMLEAKAAVDHLDASTLVTMDSKNFKLGGKKVKVAVLETTKPALPLARQDELVKAQKDIIASEKIDDMLFFVVDILNESATYLSCSKSGSSLVEKAWKVSVGSDGTVNLPGVLSRKLQIIPALEAAVKEQEL